jgi:hypothetical protein
VRDLGRDVDGVAGAGAVVVSWRGGCLDFQVQAEEGAAPFEHDEANADVDEDVKEDDDPDRPVEGGDSQGVPVDRDPAPKLEEVLGGGESRVRLAYIGRAVYLATVGCVDEEEGDGWDERQTVAEDQIAPLQLS